jgi:hypothetical protein
MLVTPRLVFGAAPRKGLKMPWLSWAVAFGSHFLLDHVPHRDKGKEPMRRLNAVWILAAMMTALSLVWQRAALAQADTFTIHQAIPVDQIWSGGDCLREDVHFMGEVEIVGHLTVLPGGGFAGHQEVHNNIVGVGLVTGTLYRWVEASNDNSSIVVSEEAVSHVHLTDNAFIISEGSGRVQRLSIMFQQLWFPDGTVVTLFERVRSECR